MLGWLEESRKFLLDPWLACKSSMTPDEFVARATHRVIPGKDCQTGMYREMATSNMKAIMQKRRRSEPEYTATSAQLEDESPPKFLRVAERMKRWNETRKSASKQACIAWRVTKNVHQTTSKFSE